MGMFGENGPFIVSQDLSVRLNPYRWNRHANVLWLDSPGGVGFSSTPNVSAIVDDKITAHRTHEFLRRFFTKYPAASRPFYIAGER